MEIDPWLDRWGRRVSENPNFWIALGKFENLFLKEQIAAKEIVSPIFVSGLARSGSTMLLEIINEHPETKSFSYQDFPFVHIYWFWSQFLKFSKKNHTPAERAHKDRILVTPESPEAMEEILWMQFFPNLHKEEVSHLKDIDFKSEDFEKYYIATIKKMLFSHEAKRYLSKANYHVTRIKYLAKLFPDAKFVIPIRDPITHIQSLLKQHKLFSTVQKEDVRLLKHFQRIGHFEFGLERAAINTGDPEDSKRINAHWEREENILGYALQWKLVYEYVLTLTQDPKLKDSIFVVKFEELCSRPAEELKKLFDFLNLKNSEAIVEKYSQQLSLPSYYKQGFEPEELELIQSITKPIASQFGYHFS